MTTPFLRLFGAQLRFYSRTAAELQPGDAACAFAHLPLGASSGPRLWSPCAFGSQWPPHPCHTPGIKGLGQEPGGVELELE